MSGAIGNGFCSFGALLKTFRQRRQLTQKQLAAAIGVHRNAIGRWEQGDFLPASKAIILELSRHLQLNEQEVLQLLEASLTALSPHWQIPFPRNPFFTGREQILDALHAQLGVNQIVTLTHSYALHGLGGIGKTQIALEYAYRYALEYSAIFWIEAETAERVVSSLLGIAEILQLSQQQEKDHQRVVTAVQQWLSNHKQWLLVCDNAEDLAMLERFLPSTRSGAILITTRSQALGTLAQGLDLLPMDQEEGVLFLLRRAKVLAREDTAEQVRQFAVRKPDQYAAAQKLVEALGGLPLALDQAGAYIEETRCGLPAYLDLFRIRRAALLQQRGDRSRDHPASVSTTLTLALRAVAACHPAVQDLLRVCAFLSPDAIPQEIFLQGAEYLGIEIVCRDLLQWNSVIAAACAYSLLSRQPEEQTLSVHRLVQAVIEEGMSEQERLLWLKRVIKALNALFPEVTYQTWRQCERLQSHVLTCAAALQDQGADQELVQLWRKTADYLRERSQYKQAQQLYEQALHIGEQVMGPQHPDLATLLDGLAWVFLRQGCYEQAEALFQRALCIQQQEGEPQSLLTARLLNGLACLYWTQARLEQAEALFQRALCIQQQEGEPQSLLTAKLLTNLAELYSDQGKYEQAEPLFQRAVCIQQQAMGPQHPEVVYPLDGLATLYYRQGKYELAAGLYRQALQIWEQAAGPEHLLIAHLLQGLADVYIQQEKGEQAEALYRRSLRIREQELGPQHPRVADGLNGLANLFRDRSQYLEAERLYRRALSLREEHLGQHHPLTAQTLHDLAILRQKQGNLSEAMGLAQRSLSIRLQSLGDAHPNTIATQVLYTQLLQDQGGSADKADSEHDTKEISDTCSQERQEDRASLPLPNGVDPSSPTNDSLQEFLEACCELHPLAWCPISDLWQTYVHWTASSQKRIPLSRRAFSVQLKLRGCSSDRTSTARIWRGIRLVHKAS